MLPIEISDASHGLWNGAFIGSLSGALAILVLGGPLGLLSLGPAAVAVGAGGGSLLGALSAGLAGLGVPDRALDGWREALEQGQVLISVRVTDHSLVHVVESILRSTGAQQVCCSAGGLMPIPAGAYN